MAKNVTISLPDELGTAMAKFPEVSWSAVARDSIETYVKLREKPDLAETVQLLIKQRGAEYMRGVEAAKDLARRRKNTAVDVVVREYQRRFWEDAERAYKEDNDGDYQSVSEVTFSEEYLCNLMLQAWKKYDSTIVEESDAFLEGFRKTILDIHDLVRKGAK